MKFVIAAMFIFFSPACASAQDTPHAGVRYSGIIAAADTLVGKREAIASVWPGFWPQSFGIYAPRNFIFVYSPTARPHGYQILPDKFSPASMRGAAYTYEGEWTVLSGGVIPIVPTMTPGQTLAGPIEIPQQLASTHVPVAVPLRPYVSTVELVLHESFHSWQLAHFRSRFPPPYSGQGVLAPSDIAALKTEKELLLAALAGLAQDKRVYERAVNEYLAARATRHARTAKDAIAFEHFQESYEGVAAFVGLAGRIAAEGKPTSELVAAVSTMVNERWNTSEGAERQQLISRTYATGASMAVILEHLGIKDWRTRVKDSIPLESVLRESITSTPAK
jgi:hypothetical protein